MGSLLLQLLPVALGIMISPLAIVAAIAVLGSDRARANSISYLIGWILGIAVGVGVSMLVFHLLEVNARRDPPIWLTIVHFVLAAALLLGAVAVLRRQKPAVQRMASAETPQAVVAAAPTLPGWLRAVDEFTPVRTGITGFGLFLLNPVDLSCAIAAALTLTLGDVSHGQMIVVAVVFVLLSSLSVLVPVAYLQFRGESAAPLLRKARDWIAGNTGVMNAVLLIVIAALQLSKGIQGL